MAGTITISMDGVDAALAADLQRISDGRDAPLTIGEVLELRDRAEDIRLAMTGGCRSRSGVRLLGRAVRVGGTELRSISLGGAIALRRLVTWAELLDQEMYDVIEAWIYAHSWSAAALARLTDPVAASEIVEEWLPSLTCTIEELRSAVADVTSRPARPADAPAGGGDGDGDPNRLMDQLMVRYGGSECRWLEVPLERVSALMDAAAENDKAAEAQLARESGKLPPAARDERVNAVARYVRTRKRLETGEEGHG